MVAADVAAFEALMAAYKLPKATDEEKTRRAEAIQRQLDPGHRQCRSTARAPAPRSSNSRAGPPNRLQGRDQRCRRRRALGLRGPAQRRTETLHQRSLAATTGVLAERCRSEIDALTAAGRPGQRSRLRNRAARDCNRTHRALRRADPGSIAEIRRGVAQQRRARTRGGQFGVETRPANSPSQRAITRSQHRCR